MNAYVIARWINDKTGKPKLHFAGSNYNWVLPYSEDAIHFATMDGARSFYHEYIGRTVPETFITIPMPRK